MQRIDLVKYKELFNENKEVLELGAELTSYGVSGRGKALLPKELNKRLPYIFSDFKKTEALEEKIKKLEDNLEKGKTWRQSLINSPNRKKLAIGAEIASYGLTTMIIKNINEQLFFDHVMYIWPLMFLSLGATLFRVIDRESPYHGPTSLVKATIDRATYTPRKKHTLKKAKRKKAKLENKIRADIALANAGKLEYAKDWLGKEKKKLEELLVSAHQEFPERFSELQKIIRPEHQLELLKHFEGFAKQLEQESWSKEKVEQHLRRYNMSKGSGIWTEEAEEKFEKELKKREKSFAMLLKPIEKLPKDTGMKKFAEEIEKAASLEHYLQKYETMHKLEKEILKQFYKQRPELAWTAREGRLDIITGDRRVSLKEMYTRRQKAANCLRILSGSSLTILFYGAMFADPSFYALAGVYFGLGGLANLIGRKDNNAETEIRTYTREAVNHLERYAKEHKQEAQLDLNKILKSFS